MESNYDFSEVDKVEEIQLCILSPNEILERSVVPVDSTEITRSNINIPQCNGVNDPRMDSLSSDYKMLCPIDDQLEIVLDILVILLLQNSFWPIL